MIRNPRFGSMICACATLLASAGCSSDAGVDIGDGKRGEALSDYADVWDGYAEAYTFSDGSDRVRVTLDHEGNGFVELGDSTSPKPTPGSPPPSYRGFAELIAGVTYPITAASVAAKRLRLEARQYPSFDAWCEEQPAVPFDPEEAPGVYSCFPNAAQTTRYEPGTENCEFEGISEAVPCNLPNKCWHQCECTESGCQGASTPTATALTDEYSSMMPPAQLDATLLDGGNTLDGTLVADFPSQDADCTRLAGAICDAVSQRLTIRLERR